MKPQLADPDQHSSRRPTAGAELALRGVSHSYGDLATLSSVDLKVDSGDVVGLVGPSGCGKSTLLELICGLREPSSGTIAVGGNPAAAERLASCAFMPQRDLLLPWYSAIDNAALALRNQGMRRERLPPICSSASASAASRRRGHLRSRAECASGSPSCAR
jgi:ABC-type nitrate/sulfonate/bicarbonate transport system ATPase subunit